MEKNELFSIKPGQSYPDIYEKAKKRWDNLTKPIDGLGNFETLICDIARIQGQVIPDVSKRAAVIMCADNGIVEEKISQSGQEVTYFVAEKLGRGTSSVCVLSKGMNVDVIPVDTGISCDEKIPGVMDMKVCRGTRNFINEAAMSEDEMLRAFENGMKVAEYIKDKGYKIASAGEMGIGNTTTSAAVLGVLINCDGAEFAGRGAGLDDKGLERKKEVIRRGTDKYSFPTDKKLRAFEAVRTLGGADIAALSGFYTGCSRFGIPVILDGLISLSAAVAAEHIVPGVKECFIASHLGREGGCAPALKELGLKPYIDADMALGEGTGAVLMYPLIDAVMNYYINSGSFSSDGMEAYVRFDSK